jgi:hypothetical protein
MRLLIYTTKGSEYGHPPLSGPFSFVTTKHQATSYKGIEAANDRHIRQQGIGGHRGNE